VLEETAELEDDYNPTPQEVAAGALIDLLSRSDWNDFYARSLIKAIRKMFILAGFYTPVSDEEYDNIQVFGGSKAAQYFRIDGIRYGTKWTFQDYELELHNK